MAEQFQANEPGNSIPTPAVTTHGVRENGAEAYPQPKKRGFPWWLLLFGLIPLLLLWNRNNSEPTPAATPVAVVSSPDYTASPSADETTTTDSAALPPAIRDREVYSGTDITVAPEGGASMSGVPLSDVATFSRIADKSKLVGQTAKLTNVNVVEVLSPRAIIVGASADQHMLVLLDERLDIGTGKQAVPVTEGQTVSLTGVIKASPAPEEIASMYGVASERLTAHMDDSVYLHAKVLQAK